jgi:hypothetical protein
MSKIKKNAENRALKILYTSVLHEKIATIFGPNVVAISTHNTLRYVNAWVSFVYLAKIDKKL